MSNRRLLFGFAPAQQTQKTQRGPPPRQHTTTLRQPFTLQNRVLKRDDLGNGACERVWQVTPSRAD